LLDDPSYLSDFEDGGFPLRYAAAWGILDHLANRPDARHGKINVKKLYIAAAHPDARLAGASLVALGFLGKAADEYLKLLLKVEEISVERVLLAIYGRRLSGLSDVPAELQNFVGAKHAALLLLQAMPGTEPMTEGRWDEFRGGNPEFVEWIDYVEDNSDVKGPFRLVLKWLVGPKLVSERASRRSAMERQRHLR
jgi:hypothetical protein